MNDAAATTARGRAGGQDTSHTHSRQRPRAPPAPTPPSPPRTDNDGRMKAPLEQQPLLPAKGRKPPHKSSSHPSSAMHSTSPPAPLLKAFSPPSSPSSDVDSRYAAHWLCFFLLGVINNFHYVIVLSSAFSLATSFSAVSLIGVIQWATVILGVVVKVVNALYLLDTSHSLRMVVSTFCCVLGLCMLTVSAHVGFWFAISAICLIGAFSALGESLVLGFLKDFHPRLTGAWSSGTGISGVAGTLGYIAMHSVLGWSNEAIYVLIVPTCAVYMLAFIYVQTTAPQSSALVAAREEGAPPLPAIADDSVALLPAANGSGAVSAADAAAPQSRFANAWRVARQVSSLCFHLTVVYFLEYVIIVGFASQANPTQPGAGWWYDNAYEILSFCYQLGVLVSRSSIAVVQVRRIHLLTALQALNFVLWFAQAYAGLLPLWLQFAWMVFVGLMGGAMYVNVFYLLRGERAIAEEDRELAINVVASVYYIGIISSSLASIVLLNTLLTRQH